MIAAPLFKSFFAGGFECSTHRVRDGRRLDELAATRHDRFVARDYARCRAQGILTVREGLRWHLIESSPGRYDFASVLPMLRAAREARTQVMWDLCHFGWPDDLDCFSPAFVERFAGLAGAFSRLLRAESDGTPCIAPMNEISWLSWSAAEMGIVAPYVRDRGFDFKRQLVRASIAAMEAVLEVDPRTRFFHNEPVFNVVPDPERPEDAEAAETYRRYQFQAWDMIAGRLEPELGGDPSFLDVIGVNYYPWNQWLYAGPKVGGATIDASTPGYRPFRDMLGEVHARYGRPLFIAETGREGERRASWLRHIGDEVEAALEQGLPVEGVCLYPIVDFPGWENDRHCDCGLWGYADERGEREICGPLALELARQQRRFRHHQVHAPPGRAKGSRLRAATS
jgi:hypothetical protein